MKKALILSTLCLSICVAQAQWNPSGTNIYNSNAGNVGVGGSTPTFKLQVSGDAEVGDSHDPGTYGMFQITRPSSPSGNRFHLAFIRYGFSVSGMGYAPGTNILGIWHAGSNSGIPLMSFTPTQSVGIGVLDPGNYKLAVEGTIGARKVKVTMASWADYVFEKDYKLPTLKEVEEFIRQNKHLPGVYSAEEIEKEGLDLGENQAVLLKKIEELTLYLIEQNKRLDQVSEENAVLKKQVEELARHAGN
ncbi:MAG TPA: hypothetical protein VK666_09925 [Chryseolinea sp.]|nr:hypothetical protein [Chryseolinea sp.]